jgi:hypothetical protein
MNWHSTAGKSALVKMLMKEHGFSKRKSEKAVFHCMARALRRGDSVELPIGRMQTAMLPVKRRKQVLQKFKNIQTGKTFRKLVRYPDKIIRFRANPKLIEKGPFPPPPPSPEMIKKIEELDQLLSGFGFPDATGLELDRLLRAAEGNLDWLLSRMRTLVRDQHKFTDFYILCGTVRDLYWIRP